MHSEISSIGSGNGLSPVRRQAFTWTNAEWVSIGPLRTNFTETRITIQNFSFETVVFKMGTILSRGDKLTHEDHFGKCRLASDNVFDIFNKQKQLKKNTSLVFRCLKNVHPPTPQPPTSRNFVTIVSADYVIIASKGATPSDIVRSLTIRQLTPRGNWWQMREQIAIRQQAFWPRSKWPNVVTMQ